ncbi:MAG: Spo0B domain-containing protein [Eubacteriales bacterium]|nr:Spo0B domain-containing protein [Eubacteriales bacterium]
MSRKPSREVNVGKASLYALIVNIMEIVVLLGFVLYVALTRITPQNQRAIQTLAIIGGLAASWGAFLDIREALLTRKRLRIIEALETTNTQMDNLNHTLRAQRHDFLNHLQVVYSLMEMEEYKDATDYLEKVYGEIRSVATFLRTNSTAVNALLQVKAGACEERGIAMQLDIKSSLDGLPMPAWELCRVLANLIDNAIDALKKTEHPEIRLTIAEDIRSFTFQVINNGPPVPDDMRVSIFEAGVSTKGEGRGMGLSIVRNTLQGYEGTITCQSNTTQTCFCVTLPKKS